MFNINVLSRLRRLFLTWFMVEYIIILGHMHSPWASFAFFALGFGGEFLPGDLFLRFLFALRFAASGGEE